MDDIGRYGFPCGIILEVRRLIASHGYSRVNNALEQCMKEDYEFLRKHFQKDVPYYGVGVNVRGETVQSPGTCESSVYAYRVADDGCQIPMVTSCEVDVEGGSGEYVQTDIASYFQGVVEEVIPADPDPETVKNLVVEAPVRKAIKKVSAESVLPTVKVDTVSVPMPVVAPVVTSNSEIVDMTYVPDDKESVGSQEKKGENKYRDPKEMKAWQKAEEDKKRAELQGAGINGYDLMTVENMKQWVEVDGKTYSAVAREYLGIPDNQVSAFGKKHGIQSSVSKRRTMTMIAKMKK